MGILDGADDQTFRVDFSADGATKLKERVMVKLKEFMGDYTDDTLVEYVIVLLRNGRQKEEARNELKVFLGDDSHSFASWLWNHLSSNLDLYIEHKKSSVDVAAQRKPASEDHIERNDLCLLDSESERSKSNKLSRTRHNRDWKGLIRDAAEPPPLRYSDIDDIHVNEKTHHQVDHRRSVSPRLQVHKKRSRPDEQHNSERGSVSRPTIHAPRRLLQFAVRDAVGALRPSNLSTEPTLKRLRSLVSASTGCSSLVDRSRRMQSVARVPNPMATVIKAVAEAAEDVRKVKSSGRVFDRLGRGMGLSESISQQIADVTMNDGECGDVNQITEQTLLIHNKGSDHSGKYARNMAVESDTCFASDSTSDSEGYDNVNFMGHRVTGASQSGTSAGHKTGNSLMVQYNVAKNNDMRKTWNKDKDQPTTATNNSRKIVNISVNVNTYEPPHFDESRDATVVYGLKSLWESEAGGGKSSVRLMKENNDLASVGNGNAKPAPDTKIESQKTLQSAHGLYSGARLLEDADSRTIFISNVNFGATKDSLSRHFNKFGDVVKLVIVTDAATGKTKGSAYVEFIQKESADNALSLDGTSFMSRIIKVVKRSCTNQEAGPSMSWPRIARGSPFTVARFPRLAFPRGYPGAFRSRLPIKPGARSMQWKRDAQTTAADSGTQSPGSHVASPLSRSLTYVRTEPKPDGKSGST